VIAAPGSPDAERRGADQFGADQFCAEQLDLAARIVASLTVSGRTVAVAESLTGGSVVAELIRIPGASLVVRGGIVAYNTALKASLLAVPLALLDAYGPVHPEVAAAMASGVRSATAVNGRPTDLGVATTGVAGPDPQGEAPVGLVYVAVADAVGMTVHKHQFSGDRASIRAQATLAALALLAEHESVAVGNVIRDSRVTDSRLTTLAQGAAVTVETSGSGSVTGPAKQRPRGE